MVNQAFRIKIAYRSEKKEENTRDRSVPDGSDKDKGYFYIAGVKTGEVEEDVSNN